MVEQTSTSLKLQGQREKVADVCLNILLNCEVHGSQALLNALHWNRSSQPPEYSNVW